MHKYVNDIASAVNTAGLHITPTARLVRKSRFLYKVTNDMPKIHRTAEMQTK